MIATEVLLARWLVAALLLTAVLVVTGAGSAFAHESRTTGDIQLVVGWGEEPAYTGFKNSVQVTVSAGEGGPPVTDVGGALQVEVSKGSNSITLPLEPSPTPGDYRAWLTPTRPGTYTFRVTGSIRGRSVDESFSSSESTFDEVEDVANIQFPARDPSTGQLAARVDREVPRAVEAGLRQADDRVDRARTIAMAGVVIGALGLVTAAAALVVARRRSGSDGGPTGGGGNARAEAAGSLSR